MSTSTKTGIVLIVTLVAVMMITACSSDPSGAEVAAKYTEQTARAIIEGAWKISGAVVIGTVIRGVMNK